MNYISTSTYDDQKLRWTMPDPAEQFSNPYLAMGNNPVMYTDPDGEFIFPALMIAGFMAGYMGTAANADNNGVHMSGRELFAAGLKGAAAGAMIAGGVASVAPATLSVTKTAAVGTKAAATASKTTKFGELMAKPFMKAGLKSGTINTLSNYDYEAGFGGLGIGTLADFGSGFAGGALGVGSGFNFLGMMVAGGLNAGFGMMIHGDTDPYQSMQRFAGGALSVYAGAGKYAKNKSLSLFKGGKNSLTNPQWKLLKNHGDTFLKYGAQSSVYDFAYTDKKYYLERNGWEHAGIFAAGGLSGVGAESSFTGKGSELLGSKARIGIGAGIYAAEWSVTSLIKQRSYAYVNGYPRGGFYTGNSSRAKGWLLLDKWNASSRGILLGQ